MNPFAVVVVFVVSLKVRVAERRVRTFVRNVVPVPVVEGDFGFGRLTYELFHVVGAEGSVAAEKDVGDDTGR